MHEAGSLLAVVGAAEVAVVVVVVVVAAVEDFGFAFFESEPLEHATSAAAVTRAISVQARTKRGIRSSSGSNGDGGAYPAHRRHDLCVVAQAAWRARTSSTTSDNDVTRSTSRSGWKSYGSMSTGCTPAASAPSTSAPGVSPTWMTRWGATSSTSCARSKMRGSGFATPTTVESRIVATCTPSPGPT